MPLECERHDVAECDKKRGVEANGPELAQNHDPDHPRAPSEPSCGEGVITHEANRRKPSGVARPRQSKVGGGPIGSSVSLPVRNRPISAPRELVDRFDNGPDDVGALGGGLERTAGFKQGRQLEIVPTIGFGMVFQATRQNAGDGRAQVENDQRRQVLTLGRSATSGRVPPYKNYKSGTRRGRSGERWPDRSTRRQL